MEDNMSCASTRTSISNLSMTSERRDPFSQIVVDRNKFRNPKPYKKDIQNYFIKGGAAIFVFITVCILCYFLTSLHYLQAKMSDNTHVANEALGISKRVQEDLNLDIEKETKEMKHFKLVETVSADAELKSNVLKGKVENMKRKQDTLEKAMDRILLNYEEHNNANRSINPVNDGTSIDNTNM